MPFFTQQQPNPGLSPLDVSPAPQEGYAMTRFAIMKTARRVFTAPAPHVSNLDRVDPKLLPLITARYV